MHRVSNQPFMLIIDEQSWKFSAYNLFLYIDYVLADFFVSELNKDSRTGDGFKAYGRLTILLGLNFELDWITIPNFSSNKLVLILMICLQLKSTVIRFWFLMRNCNKCANLIEFPMLFINTITYMEVSQSSFFVTGSSPECRLISQIFFCRFGIKRHLLFAAVVNQPLVVEDGITCMWPSLYSLCIFDKHDSINETLCTNYHRLTDMNEKKSTAIFFLNYSFFCLLLVITIFWIFYRTQILTQEYVSSKLYFRLSNITKISFKVFSIFTHVNSLG